MSLRTGAIQAAARSMARLEDEPEDRWGEYWALPASHALDALLDYLEAHTDEWRTWSSEEGGALIAALRGES